VSNYTKGFWHSELTPLESSTTVPSLQIGSPMSKAMTIAGMVVAGLLALVFAVDLAIGVPFDKAKPMMDVGGLIAAGLLGYMSWDAMRDVR
jgi:hypothetical protein